MGEEVKEKKPNKYVEGFKGFCTFLYNPDDHTVFGRGGSSWGKILIFYFIFYACLAGFFAICLTVLLQTLDDDKPTVVGRTNLPMLAIPETKLYKMNFKNGEEWEEYKKGFSSLQEKYEVQTPNASAGFYQWNEENLGDCFDNTIANRELKRGCFFVGLNRIYNWSPPKDKKMFFDCAWVAGKTGSGNLSPPFDMGMVKPDESVAALKSYYPWTSMKENGLQPVQAVKVEWNQDKYDAMEKGDSLDTFLECNAYVSEEGGDKKKLADSRPASFEIEYARPE